MTKLLTDAEIVDQLAAIVAQPTEVVSVQSGFEPWVDLVRSVDWFWRGIINGLLQRRQKGRQPEFQQPPLPPGQRCVRCDAKRVGSAVCRRVRAATVDVLTACAGNSDVEVDARISRGELALDVKGRPAAGARWATACPASVRAAMDTVETPAGRAALRLRKRVGGNAA